MIFKKIHRGETKRGCYNTVKYVLDDQDNPDRILLVETNFDHPFLHGDCIKEFAKKFSEKIDVDNKKWDLKHRVKTNKLYEHYTISFPKKDNLSPSDVISLSKEAMKRNKLFGLNRSYLLVVHGDCDKTIHAHLVSDRRNKRGIAYNPKRDMKIWNKLCSEIEDENNLTKVLRFEDGNVIPNKALLPQPSKEVKKYLKECLAEALKKPSIPSFVKQLKKQGITPLISHAKNKRVSGISYAYQNYTFKGSAIGFSWKKIIDELEYDEEEHFELLKNIKEYKEQMEALNNISGAVEPDNTSEQYKQLFPSENSPLAQYTSIHRGRHIDYYCNDSGGRVFRETNNNIVIYDDSSNDVIDAAITLAYQKYSPNSTIKLSGSRKFKQRIWRRYKELQQEKPDIYNRDIVGYKPNSKDKSYISGLKEIDSPSIGDQIDNEKNKKELFKTTKLKYRKKQ